VRPTQAHLAALALVLTAFTLAACSSTGLRRTWTIPSQTTEARPAGRIAVVGFSQTDSVRQTFETQFSSMLNVRGNQASPSYTLLPDFNDTEAFLAFVDAGGFDAYLTARALYLDEQTVEALKDVPYTPQAYGDFYDYRSMVIREIPLPGQVAGRPAVQIETLLYDAKTKQILFGAISESQNQANLNSLIHSYGESVLHYMAAKSFIE